MKLTVREVAAIKRNAQNVAAYVVKKNKIAEKVAELKVEYDAICSTIKGFEAGTLAMTGGKYMSEDLLTRVVEGTAAKYVPKEGKLVYNENEKVYEVIEEGENNDVDVPDNSPVDIEMTEGTNVFDPTFGEAN